MLVGREAAAASIGAMPAVVMVVIGAARLGVPGALSYL
jgi:hypothetical protein